MSTNLSKATSWKINIGPKNGGLEDEFHFNWVNFMFHVSFEGSTTFSSAFYQHYPSFGIPSEKFRFPLSDALPPIQPETVRWSGLN